MTTEYVSLGELFGNAEGPQGPQGPQGPRRSLPRRLLTALAGSVATGVLCAVAALPIVAPPALAARAAVDYWNNLPSTLAEPPLPQGSVLLAADGKTRLATLFLYDRKTVPLSAVSTVMRRAIVAVEDARFYSHGGVDFRGTARALAHDAAGGSTQGGSTLTQQYVKNTLLLAGQTAGDDKAQKAAVSQTPLRKLRELKLALGVERQLSKDEILSRYLNIAYFGAGAYGIEAAALRYFGVHARDLTLPQAATLAGLVKNPSGYDPLRHPAAAKDRRDTVLGRMAAVGVISEADRAAVSARPLGLHPTTAANGCASGPAPFFCDWATSVLLDDPALGATPQARRRTLLEGGLTITTTLDLQAQRHAQQAISSIIPATNRVAAATVLVTPGTGAVTAMAVSRPYGSGPGQTVFPLASVPSYQPGSTFKAFTLAAALEQGIPLSMTLPGGNHYTSRIFDNPASGSFGNSADGEGSNLSLEAATANSVNTAFVQLEEKVGVFAVADAARRAGVRSLPSSGPRAIGAREGSLTLGTREVSPLDMAQAYATFAAHGVACAPRAVLRVSDLGGHQISAGQPRCTQAFTPAVADTVTSLLAGVLTHGTGTAAAIQGYEAAGKTGTTNAFGAAWFDGYTPKLAAAVWVGDPRGPSYQLLNVLGVPQVFGGTLPARIWHDVMTAELAGTPAVALPTADPTYVLGADVPLVPAVGGLDVSAATGRLTAVGAHVQTRDIPPTAGTSPGVVVGQSPAAGEPLTAGERVTLTVSR